MTKLIIAAALAVTTLSPAAAPPAPHVVFMIGEDEYRTGGNAAGVCPDRARASRPPDHCRACRRRGQEQFPGLVEALRTADLLVLSVRRRTPRAEQLDAVRAYLAAGKPLVGLRTASHAFALRPADPPAAAPHSTWQGFDPEVLGGHYTNHHPAGPPTVVTIAPGAGGHAILQGISVEKLTGAGSLYKVSPLERGTTPLLMGAIPGQPSEPVAWTRLYDGKQARIFYTSLGHPDDFRNAEFRRLLRNCVAWAIGR